MSSTLCSILDTSCALRPVVCLSVSHSLFLAVSISFWLSLNLSLSFAGLHAGKCKTFNLYVEERWGNPPGTRANRPRLFLWWHGSDAHGRQLAQGGARDVAWSENMSALSCSLWIALHAWVVHSALGEKNQPNEKCMCHPEHYFLYPFA